MKILVAGGKGLLGTNILPFLRERFDVAVYDLNEWDITDAAAGEKVMDLNRPDWVLNLAAMTDVDCCEDESKLAQKINTTGAGTVASLCRKSGSRLIHLSTDYVFDGRKGSPYSENDEPNPISVYGRTKHAGEKMVFSELPSAVVLRAQWLYGAGGSNFVDKIVKVATEQGSVRVVNDQEGSPTYARDLAAPVEAIIMKGLSGVFHAANSGSCTWYDFAKTIFSFLGMDIQATPISSLELGRKASRPPYCVFDLSRLEGVVGIRMRHWTEALREYLEATS